MTRTKRQKHVVIYAATALFLYRLLGRVEPAGPNTALAFEIVRGDLKKGLEDVGADPDADIDGGAPA